MPDLIVQFSDLQCGVGSQGSRKYFYSFIRIPDKGSANEVMYDTQRPFNRQLHVFVDAHFG